MPGPVTLPAVVSAATGVMLLALIPPALRYRGVPGATGWIGLLAATGFWSVSYGVALTVFDPGLRVLFEITNYLGITGAVLFLVLAGLGYGGYGHLGRSGWMAGLVTVGTASWLLIATNALDLHQIVWQNYRVEPVLGAAAVRYDPTPVFYLIATIAYGVVIATTILVLETMLRYGSLYRRRALAIAASGLPVGAANVLWFLGLVWPQHDLVPFAGLDLTPMALIAVVVVNAYVLATGDFFEVAPATRRIADNVALDDVATALVMVNEDGLVVGMNDTAADIFDVDDREDAMSRPLFEFTDAAFEPPLDRPITASFSSAPGRTFEVSTSPILDHTGSRLGDTVTMQDVTRQRRRQQRLEVFNRVLRHNLRNRLTVIRGNAERLATQLDGEVDGLPDGRTDGDEESGAGKPVNGAEPEDLDAAAERIVENTGDLMRTSEKARNVVQAMPETVPSTDRVDVPGLVERIADDLRDSDKPATIEVDGPDELVVETDRALLRLVLHNVIENAIIHGGEEPEVTVTVEHHGSFDDSAETVEITVTDDGPGIPDHELTPVREGTEDQMHHGSGIGLWIVAWGVEDLSGEVDYETGEDGTTATITIPTRPGPAGGRVR